MHNAINELRPAKHVEPITSTPAGETEIKALVEKMRKAIFDESFLIRLAIRGVDNNDIMQVGALVKSIFRFNDELFEDCEALVKAMESQSVKENK